MEWGAIITMLVAGSTAAYTIQKVIRGIAIPGAEKPIVNGERARIIDSLVRVERACIAQNKAFGRVEGRLLKSILGFSILSVLLRARGKYSPGKAA